jgi:hypothetical protein
MQGIKLLRRFIAEAFFANRRPNMEPPCGQPAVDWDCDPDEPLYYHDPTSGEAFQTDDEQPWERSPLSDLQEPSVD